MFFLWLLHGINWLLSKSFLSNSSLCSSFGFEVPSWSFYLSSFHSLHMFVSYISSCLFSGRIKKRVHWDFPGSPVVGTLHFHCRGTRVQCLVKKLGSCMPCSMAHWEPVAMGATSGHGSLLVWVKQKCGFTVKAAWSHGSYLWPLELDCSRVAWGPPVTVSSRSLEPRKPHEAAWASWSRWSRHTGVRWEPFGSHWGHWTQQAQWASGLKSLGAA